MNRLTRPPVVMCNAWVTPLPSLTPSSPSVREKIVALAAGRENRRREINGRKLEIAEGLTGSYYIVFVYFSRRSEAAVFGCIESGSVLYPPQK